jgi:UDP-N-acetylglucosamine 2-epimerase
LINKTIVFGIKSKSTKNKIFVTEKDFFGFEMDADYIIKSFQEKIKIEKQELRGKPFLELFDYKGISLWWFFSQETFFIKFSNLINFIENFSNFIDQIKPDIVEIENNFEFFNIIKKISEQKNFKLKYSKISYLNYGARQSIKRCGRKYIRKNRLKKILTKNIKNNLKIFHQNSNSLPNLNEKILFASPTSYRRSKYNFQKGITENGEFLMQDIVNLLPQKEEIIGLSFHFTESGYYENALYERINSELTWIPDEVFLEMEDNDSKIFINYFNKLITENEFQNFFQFQNIPLWEYLKDIFFQMTYEINFPYWIKLLNSYLTIFSKQKPKAIFVTAEDHSNTLALISVAKKLNIKTIRIQQGLITNLNYQFYQNNYQSSKNLLGYPIPDTILVFGEFSKNVLLEHDYPEDKITVFGNSTYLELENIKNTLEKKLLHKQFNLPKNKKIILFTSSKMQDFGKNYDFQIWEHLLKYFSDDDKFIIILKPHPGENIEKYQKMMEQYHSFNFKIISGHLTELLFLSTIVVSNYSTIIMDANCMNKPVVEIKWDDIKDNTLSFDKLKVSIPTKVEHLSKTILKLDGDMELKENLQKHRDIFLQTHCNIPLKKSELVTILKNLI